MQILQTFLPPDLCRASLEDLGRNFWLPLGLVLAVDLKRRRPLLTALQRCRADDILVVAHCGLVVIDVGGAGGAEEAVDRVAFA